MTKRIINRVLSELSLLLCVIKTYRKSKLLSNRSLLSANNPKFKAETNCQICKSDQVNLLASIPVNLPSGQGHSLLYFDYDDKELALISEEQEILDRTMGFFMSIRWQFCDNCKNGSQITEFTSEHMLEYYRRFYLRGKVTNQLRRNTKELHGHYISSMLPPQSNIYEIGSADGITAEYLAGKGHTVYVFEPSGQFDGGLKQSRLVNFVNDTSVLTGKLDAIYLHHVLEHIPDPVEYLKTLMPLLKKGGLLLIQVPDLSLQVNLVEKIFRKSIYTLFNKPYINSGLVKSEVSPKEGLSDWWDALVNDHINAFTVEGMKNILKASGFQTRDMIQSTYNRITYDTDKYAWPVDEETGSPPNGMSVVAIKP